MATKLTGVQTLSAKEREALNQRPFKADSPFQEGAVFTISEITPEVNRWEGKGNVLKSKDIFIFHLKEVKDEISSSFITGGREGWILKEDEQYQYSQKVPRMGTMNIDIRSYLSSKNGLTMGEIAEELNKIFKGCTFMCNYATLIKDPRDLNKAENLGSMLELNWVKGPADHKLNSKSN